MTKKWIEAAIDEELDGRQPKDQEIEDLKALIIAKNAALDYMTTEIKKIIETATPSEPAFYVIRELRKLLPRGE